jgi:CBS domain-containing protein
MKVQEIMTREVKVCNQSDSLNTAAQLMWDNDCGCVPVVVTDGAGLLAGVVTDRDICMAAYTQCKPLLAIPVASAMSRKIVSCRADDDVRRAEALMRQNRVRRLPVLDAAGVLTGIISINDIARAAEREHQSGKRSPQITGDELTETLAAVCEPRTHG